MFNLSRPQGFKPFLGVTHEQARAAGPSPLVVKNCWDCDDDISGVVNTEAGVIEILSDIGGWGVWACEVIPALRNMDGEGKTILIRINSYGGDVFEGLAIANTIADLKAKTIVEIIGVAASIASIIACAADVVRIRKSAEFMIHRPWAFTWGDADVLRKSAEHLDLIEGQLVEVYVDRSNGKKSAEEIAAAVKYETWMSGTQAVEWGFADEVISKEVVAPAPLDAERMEASGIKNAPVAFVALAKAETAPDVEPETTPEVLADAQPEIAPETTAEENAPFLENISAQDATPNAQGVNIQAYDDHEVAAIRAAFARAKAPAKADEAMAARLTVEQAKAQAFDMLAAEDAAANVSTAIVGNEGSTEPQAKSPDQVMAEIRARQVAEFNKTKR